MSQPHAPSRKEPQGAALGVAFLALAALGALAFALLSNTPQDAAEVAQRDPLSKVPLAKVPLAKVPLSKVPLSKVPLSKVPLSKVEGEASAPHGAPSLGQSSRAESAPAPEKETWTAAARDYELRYTDARGQEIVRLIRFDPSSERVAGRLQGQGQWSYPLALPAADLDEQSGVARDLRLLVDQIGQADAEGKPLQRIGLPGGGWIEAKRKLKELPPQTRAGVSCRGATTLAELRGKTRSGERFEGQLKAELWVAAQGSALVGLRVKQTLHFADQGERAITFSLRPLAAGQRKVGARQIPEAERRLAALSGEFAPSSAPAGSGFVGLPGLASELAPTLALLGSGVLPLLFGVLLLRWLGPANTLCLFLSLAIVTTPLAVQAQDKTSFGDRFSDPTENEVAGTLLAGVAVGLGATFAFFSAPVWVPIAVGAAGVTAIGAYWFTRTPPIRKGTISDKRFEPARTYLTYVATVVPDGNGGTTTIMVPKVVHDDADYVIQINQGQESSKVYVTGAQFQSLAVGQTFDMDTMGGNRFDDLDSRRATAAEVARLKAAEARGEESVPLEGINDALRGGTAGGD